ncbi:hypothetical protein D044_1942B, partial [Vibrio parahaemolyticus EKP-026]
ISEIHRWQGAWFVVL